MNTTLSRRLVRHARHMREFLQYGVKNGKLSPIRFLIFGRGRSGSTTLVSLLNSLPDIHCDGEILNQRVPFPYSHVLARCGKSKSTVYGCKILSYQIRDVQPMTAASREHFVRRLYKNNFKIIYLKRVNLIYHAISSIRGKEFGYHTKITDTRNHGKINVDFNDLLKRMRDCEEINEYEKLLLEGVPHLSITYEKHLLNADNHQSTVELVCNHLGVEYGKAETEYRKASPETLRDSVVNYDELVEFVKGTPYSKYLDSPV